MSPRKCRKGALPHVRLSAVFNSGSHGQMLAQPISTDAPCSTPDHDWATNDHNHEFVESSQPSNIDRTLAQRSDTPIILPNRRGDKRRSLAATSTAEGRAKAMEALERDFKSTSGNQVQSSYEATWREFHSNWYGSAVDAFPLKEDYIYSVAATFKAGGYHSWSNYLCWAKDRHIQITGEWPQGLARAARRASRSVMRGIGEAKQSGCFKLSDLATMPYESEPLVKDGPVGVRNLMIAGSLFMLREIECSLALAAHVTIDEAGTVAWTLPVSKTDPRAIGKVRRWGCICAGKQDKACAACCLKNQLDLLHAKFADNNILPSNLPLFPGERGQVVAKADVVKTFSKVAERLNLRVTDDQGQNVFGGHALRVTGAQAMAAMGVDIHIIMIMARWSSDSVLRYVGEAPLEALTEIVKAKTRTADLKAFYERALEQKEIPSHINTPHPAIEWKHVREEAEASAERNRDQSQDRGKTNWISNIDSGVVHRFKDEHYKNLTPNSWRTVCGWRFGKYTFNYEQQLPECAALICGTCLPFEKELARQSYITDDDDSSQSSTDR